MTKVDEIVGFLKQNIKEPPKRILDVACGSGELVSALSSTYTDSEVFGLDIDRKALAIGIAEGRFKKAVPVHGNAYNLDKEDPNFTSVRFFPNPKNYIREQGYLDLKEIGHRKFEEELKDFDLVIAINPADYFSGRTVHLLRSGKKLDNGVHLDDISRPAKKGGYVFLVTQIAYINADMYEGIRPNQVTKEHVETELRKMRKDGDNAGLNYVSHTLIAEPIPKDSCFLNSFSPNEIYSKDLAVLFNKN